MNGRQFENKSFSVFNNYDPTPKCLCGERIIIGYATKEGYLCQKCYNEKKAQKLAEIKDRLK